MQGSANLNLMIKAARVAGRSLTKDFREVENLQVSIKGAGDFVSRADRAAEQIIKEELLQARATYGWLGEESEPIKGEDPTRRWIVDPLDGTTNFLHGLPHWAISIALEHKNEIVSAVIYDPCTDEMFISEKGQGAWLNDTRLRVSGRKRMQETIFATGVPFSGDENLAVSLKELGMLLPKCSGVRSFGAAALDLAYVAAGRFDGFWQRGLQPWDTAAGILIIRESGGLVESINPDKNELEDGELIAGNGEIFEQFSTIIRSSS
ncbi:MAG: inositol monophosphatase [Rhodobacteraceae bacterium]|nr:inositol monophosphatase [Paracoccaceae bacterium]MBT4777387.1 inositol monophosphatase [Paracoccaceae bacterium]